MSNEKILIIEDEPGIGELIIYNLQKEGYANLRYALSGEEGLQTALAFKPDLILLDLMLPGIDGLSVCRQLKMNPATNGISIVMLTAKSEDSDIVVGLELGADDYITKPFSPKVLTARIRAVLRRKEQPLDNYGGDTLKCGPLNMNKGTRLCMLNGVELTLTCSEFDLLWLLASRPGWVFTRNQIVNAIRGGDYPVTARAMDVQIVGLRRKLGEDAGIIETIRGVGYRFNLTAE